MSVERLRDAGPRHPALGAAVLVVLAVVGTAAMVARGEPPPVHRQALPDPAVTMVERPQPAPDVGRDEDGQLGPRWASTFGALLAERAVETSGTPAPGPASRVLSSTGSTAGYVWTAEVAVGPGAGWLLAAEVMQFPPWRHADPCRPERWGRATARVESCVVREVAEGSLRVRATSAPGGGPPDPMAAGWTYVIDVRDGVEHVQLLLTRRVPGTDPPPLTLDDLEAMAVDAAWFAG